MGVSHALFPRFRSGKHLRGAIGTLHIAVDSQPPLIKPRFTVVVPRKVAPLAVDRNRIKRRIRGLFTTQAVPLGFIYVFYPSKQVLLISHQDLKKAFLQLLTQKT